MVNQFKCIIAWSNMKSIVCLTVVGFALAWAGTAHSQRYPRQGYGWGGGDSFQNGGQNLRPPHGGFQTGHQQHRRPHQGGGHAPVNFGGDGYGKKPVNDGYGIQQPIKKPVNPGYGDSGIGGGYGEQKPINPGYGGGSGIIGGGDGYGVKQPVITNPGFVDSGIGGGDGYGVKQPVITNPGYGEPAVIAPGYGGGGYDEKPVGNNFGALKPSLGGGGVGYADSSASAGKFETGGIGIRKQPISLGGGYGNDALVVIPAPGYGSVGGYKEEAPLKLTGGYGAPGGGSSGYGR